MLALTASLSCFSAACSFDGNTNAKSSDSGTNADPDGAGSNSDGGVIVPPDARLIDAGPCAFDNDSLCMVGDPGGPLDFGSTLDTDNDPLCRSFTPAGGTQTCLVLVESATQSGTTSVFGSLPLVVAATGDIEVAGTFDSSRHIGGQTGAGVSPASAVTAARETPTRAWGATELPRLAWQERR
jgi:hypothetical protein